MVNSALSQALGSPSDTLIGLCCYQALHQRSAPCEGCPVFETLQQGQPREGRLVFPDGRTWLIRGYPVHDEQGAIKGAILLGQDITERQRLEEELVKSKRRETVGLLAGGIAHDLNNFLTVIMDNIELAQWSAGSNLEVSKALSQAITACQGAQRLTGKFLTYSQEGDPSPKVMELEPVVRDAAGLALAGSTVGCRHHFPQGIWRVSIDAGQIREALHQVFRNARTAVLSR